MKKIKDFFYYPIQKEFPHFCTFLFLILFSNVLFFGCSIENKYFKFIKESPVLTLSLAVCFSYLMVAILSIIRYMRHPFLTKIFLIANYIFLLILTLFESVTTLIFGKPICADIFETFFTTNSKETAEFIDTYINQLPLPLAAFFTILLLALMLRLFIQKILQKHQVSYYIATIFFIMMIPALINSTDNIILYLKIGKVKRNCYKNVNITRLAGSFYTLKKLSDETRDFELRSHPEKIQYISSDIQCSNIVVIIGEAFSKYHSSLYSYPKKTNPKLNELRHHNNLYTYNDVISPYDFTSSVLKAIYNINKHDSGNILPPFPSILRGAGYKTYYLDNQKDFMYQERFQPIWSNMYDIRNPNKFEYDKDLIDTIDIQKSESSLYVIKLDGQHITYAKRYTKDFSNFTPEDYPKANNRQQAEILAHYDNATLYNDSVIYDTIQKFADLEAVVIYFSDHGEEIYDYRNYVGHGGLSENSKEIKYLIEIPFMIWFSDTYKENHPDKAEQIKNAVDRPYITSDLTHLIMDISGVKAKGYDPTRSVINDQFDSSHNRIIIGYINYDLWKAQH